MYSKILKALKVVLFIQVFSVSIISVVSAQSYTLRTVEKINNIDVETVYASSGIIEDNQNCQSASFRNSQQRTANAYICVANFRPGLSNNALLRQGYYNSINRVGDPINVSIITPQFNCSDIVSGAVDIKRLNYKSNGDTWIKGELTCSTNGKKIFFDYGAGDRFRNSYSRVLNLSSDMTITSSGSAQAVTALVNGGTFISNAVSQQEFINLKLNRMQRFDSVGLKLKENFTQLKIDGSGSNSSFSSMSSLSGSSNNFSPLSASSKNFLVESGVDNIKLTVTKNSSAARTELKDLVVKVLSVNSWQNQARAIDVNGDRRLSSLDALTVINWLNDTSKPKTLPSIRLASEPMLDVNGDGRVSSIDALSVINALNNSEVY